VPGPRVMRVEDCGAGRADVFADRSACSADPCGGGCEARIFIRAWYDLSIPWVFGGPGRAHIYLAAISSKPTGRTSRRRRRDGPVSWLTAGGSDSASGTALIRSARGRKALNAEWNLNSVMLQSMLLFALLISLAFGFLAGPPKRPLEIVSVWCALFLFLCLIGVGSDGQL